ncbi:MAG: DNA-methyltransferase [Candidatus Sumerlaeia bacterium]
MTEIELTTNHQFLLGDSAKMDMIEDESIQLVVTSPPYPMIEMWDDCFRGQSAEASRALDAADGPAAFESMHRVLDAVWAEVWRVLAPGGFACINIGDATRSLDGQFALYANHARILNQCLAIGFTNLPAIIWRKQTNAPNKFMGSGMLPAGAYVTLEHEYILILRKGNKRAFTKKDEKESRARSAFFWEERNQWFSDVWFDLKGSRQAMVDESARKRSGAYPFELAWRLIHMYSLQGERVLDPFGGTGITMQAAMCAGRDSISLEIDPELHRIVASSLGGDSMFSGSEIIALGQSRADDRLRAHQDFVEKRLEQKGPDAFKHTNEAYGFPVMTRQEKKIILPRIESFVESGPERWRLDYDAAEISI